MALARKSEHQLCLRRRRSDDDGHKDIAVSSGSACTSAILETSYILKALGVGEDLAHTSIRFGIGRLNTDEEINYTANDVVKAVLHLREMSPLYEMAKTRIDLKSVECAADYFSS